MTRKWKGGDLVFVEVGSEEMGTRHFVKGRVRRAPREWSEGLAVTVDCADGFRRYCDPRKLRPLFHVIQGGKR